MSAKKRAPELSDWREIASLGEQLVSATSLVSQRDRIASMAGRVLGGKVEVWLNESMFRLPNWKAERAFPAMPRSEGMRRALDRHKTYVRRGTRRAGTRVAVAAVPIEDQGILLGALQVTRPKGPDFLKDELEVLESIASIVAVGLYAWHRVPGRAVPAGRTEPCQRGEHTDRRCSEPGRTVATRNGADPEDFQLLLRSHLHAEAGREPHAFPVERGCAAEGRPAWSSRCWRWR